MPITSGQPIVLQTIDEKIIELQQKVRQISTELVLLTETVATKVSKSGDIMTGPLEQWSQNIDIDVVPSTTQWDSQYRLRDKNGAEIGALYAIRSSDDNLGMQMEVSRTVNGTRYNNNIRLYLDNTGAQSVSVSNASAWQRALSVLPLAGGTMTGQIKTSFKESVATGSYQPSATTIDALLTEVRYSSGCCGSFTLNTAYTRDGVTVPTGWYNFLYVPHRSGGDSGSASGDNCNFGTLFLSTMNHDYGRLYMIDYSGSSIQRLSHITGKTDKISLFGNTRQTTPNVPVDGIVGISHFLSTSSMNNSGLKPANTDGHIIHMSWDNTGGWDSQFYQSSGQNACLRFRGQSSGTWGGWKKVYTEVEKPSKSDVGLGKVTNQTESFSLSGTTLTITVT